MESAKNKLLRVAGVIAVFCLLLYSSVTSDPIMMATPPITRRPNAYFVPYPKKPQCGTLMNSGNWTDEPVPIVDDCEGNSNYASCDLEAVRRWKWGAPARDCGAAHLPVAAVRTLLSGRWVACVGDSIARNLCAGILRAAGAPASAFFFDRHADFDREVSSCDGCDPIKVTFHWRPYPQNASELLAGWQHEKKPALVVASVTLWHMLHIGDAEGFGKAVAALGRAAADMVPKLPEVSKPVTVLATGTETHIERMLSAAKRGAMTSAAVDAYNTAAAGAGALAPEGAMGMLDMFAMTYGCGIECSVDGVHSQPAVYDASAQVLLNMLKKCGGTGKACWALDS